MKKILNIFVGISLITAGASSAVACGSSPSSLNDQKIVDDITTRLKDKNFQIDEHSNGSKTFFDYKAKVLQNIKSKLTSQEKSLVSFPEIDNPKKLSAANATDIDVHVQSHKIYQDIDINVKLNSDAQSIADKLDTQTITIYKPIQGPPDKFNSFTLSPISAYQTQIETEIQKLLTSEGVKSDYKINFNWSVNLKTNKIVTIDWIHNVDVNLNVNIGADTSYPVTIHVQLAFNSIYTQQKDEIDDPAEGSYNGPEQVNTGGATVKPSEWKDYQMVEQLNSAWNFESFSQYVSYVPINTLVPNTPVKEKLLCPLLGYTKNNPRYFYVEAQ